MMVSPSAWKRIAECGAVRPASATARRRRIVAATPQLSAARPRSRSAPAAGVRKSSARFFRKRETPYQRCRSTREIPRRPSRVPAARRGPAIGGFSRAAGARGACVPTPSPAGRRSAGSTSSLRTAHSSARARAGAEGRARETIRVRRAGCCRACSAPRVTAADRSTRRSPPVRAVRATPPP